MPGPLEGLKRGMPLGASTLPQDELSPDAQIGALTERNRLLGGQPETLMPPSSPQSRDFTFSNPDMPDIAGLINAMRGAGISGQRMTDIELPPQPVDSSTLQGLDELTRRIDVILGGGGR